MTTPSLLSWHRVARELASTPSEAELHERFVGWLESRVPVDRASFVLLDDHRRVRGETVLLGTAPLPVEIRSAWVLREAAEPEPRLWTGLDQLEAPEELAALGATGLQSALTVPMLAGDHPIGVLIAARGPGVGFASEDIALLGQLGLLLGFELERRAAAPADPGSLPTLVGEVLDATAPSLPGDEPEGLGLEDRLEFHVVSVQHAVRRTATLEESLASVAEHYGRVRARLERVAAKAETNAVELGEGLHELVERVQGSEAREAVFALLGLLQKQDIQQQELVNLLESIGLLMEYLDSNPPMRFERLAQLPFVLDALFPRDDIDATDVDPDERGLTVEYF